MRAMPTSTDGFINIDFVRYHVQEAIDHLAAKNYQRCGIQLAIIMRALHEASIAPIVGTVGPDGKITPRGSDDGAGQSEGWGWEP
jgi:hypothetical protein